MAENRELLKNEAGSFYAKRNPNGTFKAMYEQHRSPSADARKKAKTSTKPGFGDQGDSHRKAKSP